jgi:MarR family transcriptional regulator, transcriptional regulator for hemolysin
MFDSSRSAGHLVSGAARAFVKDIDRRLKPLGLSAGHIPVMLALASERVLSQKALVERSNIEQPTLSATLVRMERDELVEREPDPVDARTSLFKLTRVARLKLPRFFEALRQGNEVALRGLTPKQREDFLDVATKIISNFADNSKATASGKRP